MKSKAEETTILVNDIPLPLHIHRERRNGVRASIGKKHIILRLPRGLSKTKETEYLKWLHDWLLKKHKSKPDIFSRFKPEKAYQNGDTFRIRGHNFTLYLEKTDNQSHSGQMEGKSIYIRLGQLNSDEDFNSTIRTLISRLFGQYFLPEITQKVHSWNDRHFQKKIKSVKFRYTRSRWGSCSNTGNINLSTRLLLAPEAVLDYVIVHELCHMVEFNHSEHFWNLVERVMPDYKEHKKWLKAYGASCDF